MPKRVGVVLSGCGAKDGTEAHEAILALLSIERGGAEAVCLAPDLSQHRVIDHQAGGPGGPDRRVLAESARLAGGPVLDLAAVTLEDLDAIVFPGGNGVTTVLSNYADKGVVCDVHPDVIRLLKGHLSSRRPMGFIGLSPLLAARVLGPAAGARVTLGPRGTIAAKHAAIMGADVRPCPIRDIVADDKARVVSTPGRMYDDARLPDLAVGIDKLVRALLSLAKDRRPRPQPAPAAPEPAEPPRLSPADPIRRPAPSARR
jgi:enhancing lycopene biosynthesis protein 2